MNRWSTTNKDHQYEWDTAVSYTHIYENNRPIDKYELTFSPNLNSLFKNSVDTLFWGWILVTSTEWIICVLLSLRTLKRVIPP